ncbi:hypothetical protein ACRRTK_010555 [Alexandromys fortis]
MRRMLPVCFTSAEGGLDGFQFRVIMCKVGACIQRQVFLCDWKLLFRTGLFLTLLGFFSEYRFHELPI